MIRKYYLTAIFLFILAASIFAAQAKNYDLVIYGGTSAGIAAAIEASRTGKPVILMAFRKENPDPAGNLITRQVYKLLNK